MYRLSPTCLTSAVPAVVDTLIIGGGVMGLSTALHLSSLRAPSSGASPGILVVESDPTYKLNSACLSAGGIRQQFSLPGNVAMSLYGKDFVRAHREEVSDEK